MELLEERIRIYSRGDLLVRKGDVCKWGFMVVSGCLRSYVVDGNGREHVLQFAPENWLITDVESMLTGRPSSTFIEAVEDTAVRRFPNIYDRKSELLTKSELVEQNVKLMRHIAATNRKLVSMLSSTAEERYAEFNATYPSLIQRLPLKQIASYLGITPEYLSDIRRKIARKRPPAIS